MNNKITGVSYSIYTNKGVFALLLGSGISRSAQIPTGWEITTKLIRQIAVLEKEDPGEFPDQWYREKFKLEPDYSGILEKLTNTREERLNLLRPYFEPTEEESAEGIKSPTVTHKKIAELVKEGYIKLIVTTNFDRLLERALTGVGIEPTVIYDPLQIENSIPLVHSKVTIVKINGDYLDTKFLNIKSELDSYDPVLSEYLRYIFENFGLVICGWSAQWDHALVAIMKSANKFRFSSYFTFFSEVNPVLEELGRIRSGGLVKIKDADSFFVEVGENIQAPARNDAMHPLTPEIVKARIKKYLSASAYEIHLHDLLHEVIESSFKKKLL